jgi:hypothetical protein
VRDTYRCGNIGDPSPKRPPTTLDAMTTIRGENP